MLRRDVIPMVGRRFGRLFVIEYAGRKTYPGGQHHIAVRVWCTGCGRIFVTAAHWVRSRQSACRKCAGERAGELMSVRLTTGKTIAQVARESGLKLDTVYHRYMRGWPHARLGLPPQRRAK